MTEDLLHFIWKFKLLRPVSLCTTVNLPLKIIHPGTHNTDAGPDFSNGRIVLGDTEWAGNIEIHKHSSQWELHNHHKDKAYNNVILHIVYEHDKEVFNSMGQPIPTMELKHFIEPGILYKYENLYKNKQEIPCGTLFSQCTDIVKEPWLERMLIERLERKTTLIKELFEFTGHNWDETFYLLLCRNFGFKVNAEPFLQLGRQMPLHTLLKHAGNLQQVEALLFGQSGLLEGEFTDLYTKQLQKEFAFLRHKYQLAPMQNKQWKFLRMRPGNFPTVRIAQMAAFIQNYQHTFSKITEARTVKEVKILFGVSASAFWKTHYTLNEESILQEKKLGDSSVENILINTVCPILFFYGKERKEESLCEKAIEWYRQLKPESNNITKKYEDLSFKSLHAAHSQSLIQLHDSYCSIKKCLQCGIGTYILK
ncbi:MAG TPA: DUF2851 family protein [Bacteroidia bacterium]|jgi:hypothetical protein|nr:DUF2851 family protein [Bacteroidia bacterium]